VLIAAAGTVALSAAVHLHLWSTGYGQLPTIGPLFLFQAIVGFVLSVTLILTRRVWAAVLSFGFVCATIGGFLMAVYVGLFNFRDTWSAPFAGMAFGYEIASVVLLVAGSTLCLMRRRETRHAVNKSK
jgi:ABC-type enterochelin transport system permease subunit